MQKQEKNIILIGMMGTGKTTVGALLAEKIGFELIDLDQEIVKTAGSSIPELFANKGETFFRDMETSVLEQMLQENNRIIATGGGIVLRPQNCQLMQEQGWVVSLLADAESIIKRVGEDPNRPLLAGDTRQRVLTLLEERKHAYDFAHCTVDTCGKSAEEVAHHISLHYRV